MKTVHYYVDMDGVLAKWNADASEEETHEHGYFINREAELSAVALVRLLIDAGKKVHILSSVYEDDHSAREKREWLDSVGLKDVDAIFVPYGEDKNQYVDAEGSLPVLIDDYSKNLTAWESMKYLAIKFMNGFNNQPKLTIVGNDVKVKTDSWSGYSIDHRMDVKQMFTAVTSISEATAAAM